MVLQIITECRKEKVLLPAKSSHRLVSRTPYKHKKNLQLRIFNSAQRDSYKVYDMLHVKSISIKQNIFNINTITYLRLLCEQSVLKYLQSRVGISIP